LKDGAVGVDSKPNVGSDQDRVEDLVEPFQQAKARTTAIAVVLLLLAPLVLVLVLRCGEVL